MAPEAKRPLKVFLCHASGDKPPVRDLYKRLTTEGLDAWLDKERLLPGQDWQVEIPRAVRDADVVVVCLSNKSITKEGYVQKEIRFALDIAEEKPEGTIFLIPARLEDCPVPERLSRWQWVDLYEEHGFLQLLRSLKLRASAIGAVIEAVSYEDTDKERERRLNQLYTEGLEAFYTEDWDRACRRFQSILSEQANHKNAAEKLEEAQCQGHYAKLYSKANEAYRSENWAAAIPALEELTQKAPNYKDAAQLFRDARKREQLAELYKEAKTLHAAQKWQAVVKVFEQISIIEPNYPDADGLLASALKEVAELKRLSDLNEQYSHALREMESMNWYDARRLLENVHKSQTGFMETEKLLRKVEDEILKEEVKRQQNEQIDILYEQAHGLLRFRKWRNALEKLEDIRKLDEHFPDQDGIAEKAQRELEREEQEAERQNKLAALYAESVRLLKEEKYQDALDKWQEVKAIDPKYPDRQWVQRLAKKRLAGTVKTPTKIREKLLLRIIVVIAIISFISGVIVASMKYFNDPTMYDDFDNTVYDNSYNKTLWEISGDPSKQSVYQTDGQLAIEVYDASNVGFFVPKKEVITKPTFFEMRAFLDPNTVDVEAHLYMNLVKDMDHTNCGVFGAGNKTQTIKCWSQYYGKKVEPNLGLNGIPPGWHTYRFEIEPETMTIAYIIDGRQVSKFVPRASIPEHFAEFRNVPFTFWIGLNNIGPSKAPIGYIDYVRMGAIEDDRKAR